MSARPDEPAQGVQIDQVQDLGHRVAAAGRLTVSVALCTFNGQLFIQEQMRSICLQTLPPQEILISDDGSDDDSIDLARATLLECQQVRPGLSIDLRVIRNPVPLRVTKNFEQAVQACRSDLIALSDQDDVWTADRLARMVAQFEERPALLLLHTDARLVDASRQDLGESLFHALEVKRFELNWVHAGRAFDVLLRRNLVTGATTVFRRTLLTHAAPFPVEWLHDEWLAIIAAALGQIDVLEEELIEYRQHGGNQIGARRDSFIGKIHKTFKSRGNNNMLRTVKAEILLYHLLKLGDLMGPDTVEKVRGKVAHQRFRAALPASRFARVMPVIRESLTGRYEKFGRGARGIVRDLFESV